VSLRLIDQELRIVEAVKLNLFTLIGLVLLLAIVGCILFLMYFPSFSEQDQSSQEALQSTVVRSGDLTISVSGSGELVPVSEANLGFEESGELLAVYVAIGDQVLAGDVLATMNLDRTEADLAADLAKAELDVLLAQQELDQTYENAQLESAAALLALEEAQLAVEALLNYSVEQALALQNLKLAEEAVQEAEMNLYITNSTPSQQAINTAYASLQFKEKELGEIQDQLARAEYQFKSASDPAVRDRLEQQILSLRVQLANQQIAYENAFSKYETLEDPPEEVDLTLAEARLATARAQQAAAERNWKQVLDGPPAGDLAVAEAQLDEAQAEWERLQSGPDPEELMLLEAQLEKAELKLRVLQGEALTLDLVAPMDGTVLSLEADVGDRVGNKTIITLGDLSQMIVAVSLDEVDTANLEVDNRVEISFDVIPGRKFQGEIVQMSPSLIKIGSSEAFRIWVELDDLPNDLIKLPLGINADVDVITGEVRESVLISIEALHEDVDGGFSVYVIEGDDLDQRAVQVGLMDATTAEITAGLLPGEQVLIGNLNLDRE
jgi:multidrug efflux pump subunit AcrA (membrane-fusion protein)